MNTVETTKMLTFLKIAYPKHYEKQAQEEFTQVAARWCESLQEYSMNLVMDAVELYIKANKEPPTPENIIGIIQQILSYGDLSPDEAWELVLSAIKNSVHNSEAEFKNLPLAVQYCVTGAARLKAWAAMPEVNIKCLVEPSFKENYKEHIKLNEEYEGLSPQAREYLGIERGNYDALLHQKYMGQN